MITDVHAHSFPAELLRHIREAGIPFAPGSGSLRTFHSVPAMPFEARLPMMDAAGVERQILSLAIPTYVGDPRLAVETARLTNDLLSKQCALWPEQFGFWAALPLPHLDAALLEAERALDQLRARGIILHCSCLGESIADERFDPLYAELDRRASVIFLHPCQDGLGSRALNAWDLTVCAGASMEDTVTALHLITREIPQRFPRLRFIVPHLGGLLPVLLERLDGQMPRAESCLPPSEVARGFYYDSVGWGSRPALRAAVEAFGASQIVPGSDFPVLLPSHSYPETFAYIRDAGLADADVDRILHRNASRLLDPGKTD